MLGLCISGNLGFECCKFLIDRYSVNVVLTDKSSTDIIEFCKQINLPVFIGNPRKSRAQEFLKRHNVHIDILLSINYLFLIEEDLIGYPRNYAVNFHGSLLPKYRGRTPHVWAIINGEKITGISAHLITPQCDEGDIVRQIQFPIEPNDTGGNILQEFKNKYPEFIEETIKLLISPNVENFTKQDSNLATYYGKRTPINGKICWSWHKERIYNWVRAQADPYPMAFTFYKGLRIKINKVEFSDLGYTDSILNGSILKNDEDITVKTPNGAILIKEFHMDKDIKIKVGDILE